MKLEQTFFVGAHDVDLEKKVTNKELLEMLSDISMLHGVKSGQTKTDEVSPVSWVVLGWRMQVYRRPFMFSTLRAVTWVRDYTRVRAGRDYMIYDEEENIVVKATAEWVALDVPTGRFLRITPELLEPFDPEPDEINYPGFVFPLFRRIDMDILAAQEMEIDRMMFDYNGHVHNSVYLNMAEQILPEDLFRKGFDDMLIVYKMEITSETRVLLEYSVREEEHVVAVRRIADRKLHAVVRLKSERDVSKVQKKTCQRQKFQV